MIVEVPLPLVGAIPGLAVIDQSPNDGNPFNVTPPVEVVHVGWTIPPIVGEEGISTMTTEVVAVTIVQLPAAGIVYVTVYVPAVLKLGVIAPVVELIDKPEVEE
jgi:hypothetical protein